MVIKIIAIISALSSLIPLIIVLFFYKSFRSYSSKTFIFFIISASITDVINVTLGLLMINNLWLNNIYVFIPLITFQFILYFEDTFNKKLSNLINIILSITYLLGLLNIQNFYQFNSSNYVIASFLLVIICSILLFNLFYQNQIIKKKFIFSISSIMLFYASTTLILYGLINYLNKSELYFLWFYTLPQTIINVTVNILFAKVLYGNNEK